MPAAIRRRVGADLPLVNPVLGTFVQLAPRYHLAQQHLVAREMVNVAEKHGGLGKWLEKVTRARSR